MIKKTIKKIIKETEEIKEQEFCDWCKKEIINNLTWDERNDFELSHEYGMTYPEGDSTETKHVELCLDCIPKLFELLEKNGININKIYSEDYYDQIEIIED
jgi:hypothetical protein